MTQKLRSAYSVARATLSAAGLLATLTGCGKALEDLVRVARPNVGGPIVPFEGQSAIKISPGNTIATSSDVSMRAHVTITDRPLTGTDVSARVSVGRHRDGSIP